MPAASSLDAPGRQLNNNWQCCLSKTTSTLWNSCYKLPTLNPAPQTPLLTPLNLNISGRYLDAPFNTTKDGIEQTLASNFFGHCELTLL